jgi:replicative DNA helicase
MDRDEAEREIRARGDELMARFMKPAKKKGTYICPVPRCGNGSGETGDGITKIPEGNPGAGKWKCFKCGAAGDVFDWYGHEMGVTDFVTQRDALAGMLGITIDSPSFTGQGATKEKSQNKPQEATGARGKAAGEQKPKEGLGNAQKPPQAEVNYLSYYKECNKNLEDPRAKAYLEGRGISLETAKAYKLGFDPQADPAHSGHPSPRIIIPTTTTHYVGRSIDPATPPKYAKLNVKGGKPWLFNGRALSAQEAEVVFILEGAFDALSVLEVGKQAIALNSTSNARKLLEVIEKRQAEGTLTRATFVLCLDNDEAGEKAQNALRDGLTRLNVPYMVGDICPGCKDANEALTKDRAAFEQAVNDAIYAAGKRPDNVRDYIKSFMSKDIERFKTECKTGFQNLDALAGGMYAGLYVLAAISSLGKTTLAAQLADQMAAAGNEVLFFSLEQSRLELVSKSISRTLAQKGGRCIPSLAIRKGYLPEDALSAAEEYATAVGDRLSIVEGNFSCDITFIGEYVRRYAAANNSRPVVIVDYLQILQPPADAKRQTTKETVDQTVTALKRLSRELEIPVLVISSVNRANYLAPFDFESLKESGGIEYSADVVWGLQLQCLGDPLFSEREKLKEKRERVRQAKAENPRKIELVCLKNRYGISSYSCLFDYYPDRDLFVEGAELEQAARGDVPTAGELKKRQRKK